MLLASKILAVAGLFLFVAAIALIFLEENRKMATSSRRHKDL